MAPVSVSLEDAGSPFERTSPNDPLDCHEDGIDGLVDISVKFDNQKVVEEIEMLGLVKDGDVRELCVIADTLNGQNVHGCDVVIIKARNRLR